MDQLLPLMESQQRDKNHYTDEHGLWIFCYYHKEWELTKQVEYGSKVNTSTGLNSMCKVGTNQWTRQQREFKQSKSNLLELVSSGELEVSEIDSKINELEIEKNRIVPLIDYHHEEGLQMNK
jgi:replicative DNA helicase